MIQRPIVRFCLASGASAKILAATENGRDHAIAAF